MERRLIAREEAVVVANVMLDDLSLPSSALPSRVPASELPALVASALHWMGLPSFDVLLVCWAVAVAHPIRLWRLWHTHWVSG